MVEARFWNTVTGKKVQCFLCPHHCMISAQKSGICRVRTNQNGILVPETYARVSSIAVDPVEKKPLYHFFPGSRIFSMGSVGCNLGCYFCQNWRISQASPLECPLQDVSPEEAVKRAMEENTVGIAFTYNEPFIWWEYVFDTAKLARKKGLKVVFVTNGYIEKEPLRELLPLSDAMNIDLKAMDDSFYRKYCKGRLQPVIDTITMIHEAGIHLEITNLLLAGLNDSPVAIERLVEWVYNLDSEIPLHFSRAFPAYQCNLPPTPPAVMGRVWRQAREKLSYVYQGNIAADEASSTFCSSCGKLLVERSGYAVSSVGLQRDRCRHCGKQVKMVVK